MLLQLDFKAVTALCPEFDNKRPTSVFTDATDRDAVQLAEFATAVKRIGAFQRIRLLKVGPSTTTQRTSEQPPTISLEIEESFAVDRRVHAPSASVSCR